MWRHLNIRSDVNEISCTTRGGIENCHTLCELYNSSNIINEDVITYILTLLSSATVQYHQQNSSALMSLKASYSQYSLMKHELSCHGGHKGMTIAQTLLNASRETPMFNRLCLILIAMHMIPPQKQTVSISKSFDIYNIYKARAV